MTPATTGGVIARTASDRCLARMAAGGSDVAFAVIFERYRRALHRYCASIVGNEHDAADALQNTMLRAIVALPGDTREISLRPWLFHVAHNESISLLRARRSECDLDHVAELGDDREQIGRETRERMRDLTADLSVLTDQQRKALLMRELGGMGFDDVAATLGISVPAAKQSAYDARRALTALADGRSMDCRSVRHTLADGDQRILRGLRIRSHLRSCASCHDYWAATRRPTALAGAFVACLPLAGHATFVRRLLFGAREIVATGTTASAAGFIPWAVIVAVGAVAVSAGMVAAREGGNGARATQEGTTSAVAVGDRQQRATAQALDAAADSSAGARMPVPTVSGATLTSPSSSAHPRSASDAQPDAPERTEIGEADPVADVRGGAKPRAHPPGASRRGRGSQRRRHVGGERAHGARRPASPGRRHASTRRTSPEPMPEARAGHRRRPPPPDARPDSRPGTKPAGGAPHAPAAGGSHPAPTSAHGAKPLPSAPTAGEPAAPPSTSSGAPPADRPATAGQNPGQPGRPPVGLE